MSTDIGKVNVENKTENKLNGFTYEKVGVSVRSFWGGGNGTMVQITLSTGDFAQLTRKQAYKLRKLIKKAFQ